MFVSFAPLALTRPLIATHHTPVGSAGSATLSFPACAHFVGICTRHFKQRIENVSGFTFKKSCVKFYSIPRESLLKSTSLWKHNRSFITCCFLGLMGWRDWCPKFLHTIFSYGRTAVAIGITESTRRKMCDATYGDCFVVLIQVSLKNLSTLEASSWCSASCCCEQIDLLFTISASFISNKSYRTKK